MTQKCLQRQRCICRTQCSSLHTHSDPEIYTYISTEICKYTQKHMYLLKPVFTDIEICSTTLKVCSMASKIHMGTLIHNYMYNGNTDGHLYHRGREAKNKSVDHDIPSIGIHNSRTPSVITFHMPI